MRTLFAIIASLLFAASAAAQTIAVTNGRVITNAESGVIDNGTVLIRDGAIAAVGADVEIPQDARVIDAGGGWITPGLFAPFTQLGLIEVSLESSTNDASASGSDFSAALRAADAFNPNGIHIPDTRVRGVTRFALFPNTGANIIAGRGALGHTGGGYDALFAVDSFMVADLSQSGAGTAGGSRAAAWAFLNAALADARGYPGRFMAHHEGDAVNRFDAAALVDVVRGRMPMVITVDRASDIRRAIQFQRENPPVRVIIRGGAEAWMVADELAAARIAVLMDPLRNLPSSFDAIGSTLTAARRLHEAGVTVAYTTQTADGYFNARLLPQHAGNAVAHGVPWDAAFRAITLTPAEIFGAGDRYGALAPGYAADVVIWDGDPLEVMSAPVTVIIDGVERGMDTRQRRLRDRYMDIDGERPFAYRR